MGRFLSLKHKLLAASLVLVLGNVALGVYAVRTVDDMAALVRRFYTRNFMATTFAQAAHTSFVKVDRALLIALAAPDTSTLDRQVGVLEVAEKTFLEDLQIVADRATTPKAQSLVGEVGALFEAWKGVRTGLISQARQRLGDPAARGRSPTGPAAAETDLVGRIEEKLTTLTDHMAEIGFGLTISSQDLGRVTLYIVVFTVIASLVVSTVLSRRIVSPLQALVVQFKQICEGDADLTCRLTVTSRDEVGGARPLVQQVHGPAARHRQPGGARPRPSSRGPPASSRMPSRSSPSVPRSTPPASRRRRHRSRSSRAPSSRTPTARGRLARPPRPPGRRPSRVGRSSGPRSARCRRSRGPPGGSPRSSR